MAAAGTPANIVFFLDPVHKLLPVTDQGILWDVAIVIRFIFIIYLLQLIMFTTPTVDLILGLVKWKVPANAALAISIGLGFVPVFANVISTITRAQQISVAIESRGFGHNIEKRTWTRNLKFNTADYVVSAISIIFFMATEVLTSMGYGSYWFTYSLIFR